MEERIEALEEAFAECEKAHKQSVRMNYMAVVLECIAASMCFASGVRMFVRGWWVMLAVMVVMFWVEIYLMVRGIVMLDRNEAEFRSLKAKHTLFVVQMRNYEKEGNNNENAEN